MKRLVYSPEVNVWIKGDHGIFDLSPYVTHFSINRKVNSVSTAELTFRNPKVDQADGASRYLFTEFASDEPDGSFTYAPMFHPMDPIIITLTRLKGYPVQVFTGYCDTSPYVQLFPGTASLTASCTLKRLMYTYWDPGVPFVTKKLASWGWAPTEGGLTTNVAAENKEGLLTDSSIGYLLYQVLTEVGGWSDDDIYIQELPSKQISDAVTALYKDIMKDAKASSNMFRDFLTSIVGVGYLGSGGGAAASGGNGDSTSVSGQTGSAPTLPDDAPVAVKQLLADCDSMASSKTKYVWGGNHDDDAKKLNQNSSGEYEMDCSGFVSWALAKNNMMTGPTKVSGEFESWGKAGEGKYFTVWCNGEHIFMEWKGTNNRSCVGTTTSAGAGHTVAWHTHTTSGFTARHYQDY